MSQINFKDQEALNGLIQTEFSEWSNPIKVDQKMINDYAELSGDDMWMHVDVERCAKESPFGKPIAHGFLILSLLPKMQCGENITELVGGYSHMMNYGSDRLRFLGAVPVDSEIHARGRLKAVEVSEKKTKVTMEMNVNVVGQDDMPALVYDLSFVFM